MSSKENNYTELSNSLNTTNKIQLSTSSKALDNLSIETLKLLTGLPNLNDVDVLKKNKQYTNNYKVLVDTYKFSTFYDLYFYIKLKEEQVNDNFVFKGGQKDLSNLNRVRRTVIRNGKPVEMNIYEKQEDGEEPNKNKKVKSPTVVQAKEISASLDTDLDHQTSDSAKKVLHALNQLGHSEASVETTSSSYRVGSFDEDTVAYVIVFTQVKDKLAVATSACSEQVLSFPSYIFYSLIAKAYVHHLGAEFDTEGDSYLEALCQHFTLKPVEKESTLFTISAKDLEKALGGNE